jgi:hypothetical protein
MIDNAKIVLRSTNRAPALEANAERFDARVIRLMVKRDFGTALPNAEG